MFYLSAANLPQNTERSFGYVVFSQFLLPIILVCAAFIIIKKLFADSPKEIFAVKKTNTANVLLAVVFGFLLYFVIALISGINLAIWDFFGKVPSMTLPVTDTFAKFAAFVVVFAILPAIAEEFIYRGAIFSYSQSGGKPFAIIFSSLCFAFMHMQFYQIGYAFFAGLLFSLFILATKDIWFVVIMHFVNNFISLLLKYLHEGFDIAFDTNALGMTLFETITAFISLGVFIVCFSYFLQKNKAPQESDGVALEKENTNGAVKYSLMGFIPCLFIAILLLF